MKVTIGEYEVEVKAKKTFFRDKFNKADTESFLLDCALAFMEASDFCKMQGRQTMAKDNLDKWRNIHDALEEAGYFKDI